MTDITKAEFSSFQRALSLQLTPPSDPPIPIGSAERPESKNLKRVLAQIQGVVKVGDALGIQLPVSLEESRAKPEEKENIGALVDYRTTRSNKSEWGKVLRSVGYEPTLPPARAASGTLYYLRSNQLIFFCFLLVKYH